MINFLMLSVDYVVAVPFLTDALSGIILLLFLLVLCQTFFRFFYQFYQPRLKKYENNKKVAPTTFQEDQHADERDNQKVSTRELRNAKLTVIDVYLDEMKVVWYRIQVKCSSGKEWQIIRRYSEFFQLKCDLNLSFPSFPSRTLVKFRSKFFLLKRLEGLNDFVQSIECHQELMNRPETKIFFGFQ